MKPIRLMLSQRNPARNCTESAMRADSHRRRDPAPDAVMCTKLQNRVEHMAGELIEIGSKPKKAR